VIKTHLHAAPHHGARAARAFDDELFLPKVLQNLADKLPRDLRACERRPNLLQPQLRRTLEICRSSSARSTAWIALRCCSRLALTLRLILACQPLAQPSAVRQRTTHLACISFSLMYTFRNSARAAAFSALIEVELDDEAEAMSPRKRGSSAS
jgi:hypothetical protein